MSAEPKIRIAHCVHGLGLGGAQKVIAAIVRETDAHAFQHFVYSCADGVHREEIEQAGATVRIIERVFPKFDPLWVAGLARAMRADGIDLVHTHLFGDSLHGYLASRAAGGVPVVMTLHIGVEGLSRLQQAGYRWLLSRCARAVACSMSVQSSYDAFGHDGGDALEVIANGIAVPPLVTPGPAELRALRHELGAGPDDLLLASIGRLEEQKGQRHLLAALASLVRDRGVPARLIMLGDGTLRRSLEGQARDEGVSDRVLFAGIRPDVMRLLGAIDVVVFSSLFEGLPVALLEAMAMGRCIVATGIPGIVEAVRDGKEAVIVPPADAPALCEGLHRVATAPALAVRLGAAARRRFVDQFTAERMAERYASLYREILGASGKAAVASR